MIALGETDWLEAIPDAVVITDSDGKIVFCNSACQQLLDWTLEELRGQSVECIVPSRVSNHADLRKRFNANPSRRPMGSGAQVTALNRSGEEVPVDITLNPVLHQGDTYMLTTIRDMRSQTGEADQLRVLSVAVHSAANGVVITNNKGVITWVNPAACRITGYKPHELVGQSTSILKSGLHDKEFYDGLWKTIAAGKVWRGDIINKRKDGTLYDEEQTIAPVCNAVGETTHFIAIKQDVSERVYAEKLMRTASHALNSAGGIAVTEIEEHRLSFVNPAILTMWGYEREEEMTGRQLLDLWKDKDDAEVMISAILRNGNGWHGEMIAKRKDGSEFSVQVAGSKNSSADGSVVGAIFSFLDMTDRKQAEEVMRQAEGQKAMVASLAAVCHHLGQPATRIGVTLELMERLLGETPEDVQEILTDAHAANKEIREILKELQRIDLYELSNYLDSAADDASMSNKILHIDTLLSGARLLNKQEDQF